MPSLCGATRDTRRVSGFLRLLGVSESGTREWTIPERFCIAPLNMDSMLGLVVLALNKIWGRTLSSLTRERELPGSSAGTQTCMKQCTWKLLLRLLRRLCRASSAKPVHLQQKLGHLQAALCSQPPNLRGCCSTHREYDSGLTQLGLASP